MALSAATVWEVRTTGSDTACSGGFVTGAAGTDYSQQDTAQATGTNLTVHASTNTDVLLLMTRVNEVIADWTANSRAKLNTILKPAVNTRG